MISQEKPADSHVDISDIEAESGNIVGEVAATKGIEGSFVPINKKKGKTMDMTKKKKASATRWVDFYHHLYRRSAGIILSTIGILTVGFLAVLFVIEVKQSGAIVDLVKMIINSYLGVALLVAWALIPLLGVLSERWKDKQSKSDPPPP